MAERERETIVYTDGDRGGGAGAIIAVILLLAVIVIGYLLYSNGVFSGGGETKVDVKIENPVGGGDSK